MMDYDITTLGFFFIVVGIPVIFGVMGDIHKRRLKLEEKRLELMGTQTAEKAAQYAAQTERLEARVQVLERILTDRSADLAAQIDALADERRAN